MKKDTYILASYIYMYECTYKTLYIVLDEYKTGTVSTSQILFLQRLVECADSLSDTDVRSAICELAGSKLRSSGTDNCVSIFRKRTDNLKLSTSQGHVLLILDKENRSTG